jgi:uncharacterized protein (DUF2236 family)
VTGGIARRINAERLVLLGWSRAILLQFAHPLIAAGVYDHSAFRQSPAVAIGRLHHTVRSMLSLAFGDEESQAQTIETIRAIHRRVHGRLPAAVGPFPAGTAYSAEDADLVLWVHATLMESVPLVFERLVGPLSETEHDEYCRAAAPVAVTLGARDEDVPRSRAALRRYLDDAYCSGRIVVGPTARELARALMRPRGRAVVAPAAWANDLLTVGLLPAAIREQYGFPWSARREQALSVVVGGIRGLRRRTPDRLALWKDARR